MKERGIIFSAPMVRALLAGQKTQTRRIVKPQPENPEVFGVSPVWGWGVPRGSDRFCVHAAFNDGGKRVDRWLPCSYGKPGDRLWVRETWQALDECGYQAVPNEGQCAIEYRADGSTWDGPWRSPIYMPRWASRITLEVVGVRIERLHEITEDDAGAEGVAPAPFTRAGRPADQLRVEAYEALWEQIHGAGSWAGNPCVWVIEFRRVQP